MSKFKFKDKEIFRQACGQVIDTMDVPNVFYSEITIYNSLTMGHRICANCGNNKDTSGGKTCSKGHFICYSCSKNHIHCPLCGHTLR